MNLVTPRPNVIEVGRAASGETSRQGTVRFREHWDGRVDCKALPGTIRARARTRHSQVLAFFELEDAVAELRRAQLSGERDRIRQAEHRFETAQSRFGKVKFGEAIVEAQIVS